MFGCLCATYEYRHYARTRGIVEKYFMICEWQLRAVVPLRWYLLTTVSFNWPGLKRVPTVAWTLEERTLAG